MTRSICKGLLALFMVSCAWFLIGNRSRDTIVLIDGTTLTGTVVSQSTATVTFKSESGPLQRYDRDKVKNIQIRNK